MLKPTFPMKINVQSQLKMLLISFIFIFHFSCSKDSDLLADYVALDPEIGAIAKFVKNDTYQISISSNSEDDTFEIIVNSGSDGSDNSGSGGTTVNDSYQISSSASIVLDVLANDTFKDLEDVSIIETSIPDNGEVVINADNTLTYTPNTLQAIEDSFSYTTEIVNEDLSVTSEVGTVTIFITLDANNNTPETNNNTNCVTNGGRAGDTGLKTWCWGDVALPTGYDDDYEAFSNNQLGVNSHCNTGMVTQAGDRLYFKVNPTTPAAQGWCGYSYNYRAEIRESPRDVNHPIGTESWYGWNYTFGNDYIIDNNEWLFWQVHDADGLHSNPLISLWLLRANQNGTTAKRGEITIVNTAQDSNNHLYVPTGIVPVAGDSFDIVVHVIWGTEANGLYEVWISPVGAQTPVQVYSQQIRTVPTEAGAGFGGYAKWGIYKWRWKDEIANINISNALGITELNTSMGPLRIITRSLDDPNYLKDSYSEVAPR